MSEAIDTSIGGDAADTWSRLEPSAERIKAYRAENGCSLVEAKRVVFCHQVADALFEAKTVTDLKPVLEALLRMVVWSMDR